MQTWEIDNGILNVRLSGDGSTLHIQGKNGSWESENFIRAVYGNMVRLELLKYGRAKVAKENGTLKIHIGEVVWYARSRAGDHFRFPDRTGRG